MGLYSEVAPGAMLAGHIGSARPLATLQAWPSGCEYEKSWLASPQSCCGSIKGDALWKENSWWLPWNQGLSVCFSPRNRCRARIHQQAEYSGGDSGSSSLYMRMWRRPRKAAYLAGLTGQLGVNTPENPGYLSYSILEPLLHQLQAPSHRVAQTAKACLYLKSHLNTPLQ